MFIVHQIDVYISYSQSHSALTKYKLNKFSVQCSAGQLSKSEIKTNPEGNGKEKNSEDMSLMLEHCLGRKKFSSTKRTIQFIGSLKYTCLGRGTKSMKKWEKTFKKTST